MSVADGTSEHDTRAERLLLEAALLAAARSPRETNERPPQPGAGMRAADVPY